MGYKATSSRPEPQHRLADGLGRSLASEESTRKFVTLALDGLGQDLGQTADVIIGLLRGVAESAVESLEINYAAIRNLFHIRRIRRIPENVPMKKRVVQGIYRASKKSANLRAILRLRFT